MSFNDLKLYIVKVKFIDQFIFFTDYADRFQFYHQKYASWIFSNTDLPTPLIFPLKRSRRGSSCFAWWLTSLCPISERPGLIHSSSSWIQLPNWIPARRAAGIWPLLLAFGRLNNTQGSGKASQWAKRMALGIPSWSLQGGCSCHWHETVYVTGEGRISGVLWLVLNWK